jgi:hypothetical protein
MSPDGNKKDILMSTMDNLKRGINMVSPENIMNSRDEDHVLDLSNVSLFEGKYSHTSKIIVHTHGEEVVHTNNT